MDAGSVGSIITSVVLVAIIVIVVGLLISCVKIVPQAQALVVERLGAYQATWAVGLHFKIPIIERVARRVDLKEQVVDFAPQPVITKDNVTMRIDTVVFYQITDPKMFCYGVANPIMAIENLTATTLRNIIGDLELDQTLTSRETINTKMRDSGLKAYTAKAMSGKVSDTLEQMRSYSALLIGLLFLMAVLALICIFNITVNERLKEFGVLLSIGARKSQIFQMLLLEAGMIGVLGGFLGVVFSGGGILLFKDVIMESMNMPYLNVNVSQYVILALQSLGLAVGVSLLATLYAAVRANRMELYKLIQEVES